jgi:hypothetical protein
MSKTVELMRHDRGALEQALRDAGAEVPAGAKTLLCPFHADGKPSGSIFERDGIFKFHCFTCDKTLDVWDVLARNEGRPVETVMSEARQRAENRDCAPATARTPLDAAHDMAKPPKASRRFASVEAVVASFGDKLAAAYAYTGPATGRVDLLVIRTLEKEFFQFHQERPGGEIVSGAPAKPWPIYNRARVAQAQAVVVVEGEKDVHTLHALGVVATTSPGGAKNAANADWTPLAGKDVTIWPDNDEPGETYAGTVRGILEKLASLQKGGLR